MLEIGEAIRKQLGSIAEHDLLASWMAEYLGEKLYKAKRTDGESQEAQNELPELIMKLWERRHTLPNGARPLESFEPIFNALSELSQDQPRYRGLRALPKIEANSEVSKKVGAAIAIDKFSSTLIRHLLAEAVEMIPESDKQWASLKANTQFDYWDIEIVSALIDDAEDILGTHEKLKVKQQKNLLAMLESVKQFEIISSELKAMLEEKLDSNK